MTRPGTRVRRWSRSAAGPRLTARAVSVALVLAWAMAGVPAIGSRDAAQSRRPAEAPRTEARPPRPGPSPFGPGERARYDVGWQAAGASMSAATAETLVSDTGDAAPAAFQFELSFETSPWFSWLFEARDRFWTVATSDLMPLRHRQEILEGRRRLERTAIYDARARTVRSGEGRLATVADGVTAPLDPAARDPMTAFFYVRTLALAPGTRIAFPVNNMGRPMTVEVRAGNTSTIPAEGRSQTGQRIEIGIQEKDDPGPGLTAVAWLSVDARRVPLRVEFETAVGAFRATLASYHAPVRRAAPGKR